MLCLKTVSIPCVFGDMNLGRGAGGFLENLGHRYRPSERISLHQERSRYPKREVGDKKSVAGHQYHGIRHCVGGPTSEILDLERIVRRGIMRIL